MDAGRGTNELSGHCTARMSSRIALAAAIALPILTVAQLALATPSARLVYSRGPGAESCPDEAALRKAVASRVGYDPFFAWAEKTIVASLLRVDPKGFVARVHLVDSAGVEHGSRELRSDQTCADLLDAAALAIAIAIDPLLLVPVPQSQQAAPEVAPAPAPLPLVDAPRTRPPSTRPVEPVRGPSVVFSVSAGAVASVGVAQAPAAGLSLGGDARWRAVSLAVEARIDAPASRPAIHSIPVADGPVSSWLLVATVAPCGHASAVEVCALAQLGSLQASANVANQSSGTAPWLAIGGRVGVRQRISGETSLRLRADLLANLDPASITVGGVPAWTAPRVAASYGLDVLVPFP
jgi:hypothetical protein